MSPRQPVITDPAVLAEVAGTAYVCLRPSGEVSEVFDRVQRRLRDVVGDDRASWPAAHMTLKGFGTPARPVDHDTERELVSLVEGWAGETMPLELQIEGVDVFAEERIPILLIRRTTQLTAAHKDMHIKVEAAGLPGQDHVALRDWIFHLSLVYYDGDRWPEVEAAARALSIPRASCLVGEAELLGFDGGPERLLDRCSLLGSA